MPQTLLIEKGLDVGIAMRRRLEVDDPAHAGLIDKASVEHDAAYLAIEHTGERVLRARVGMRSQNPLPAFVLERIAHGKTHLGSRRVELRLRHAEMRQRE